MKILIIFVVLIIISLAFVAVYQIIPETTNKFILANANTIDEGFPAFSGQASLGNYDVTLLKNNNYETYTCKTQPSGDWVFDHYDEFGCPIWVLQTTISAYYTCSPIQGAVVWYCMCGLNKITGGRCSTNSGDTHNANWVFHPLIPAGSESGGAEFTSNLGCGAKLIVSKDDVVVREDSHWFSVIDEYDDGDLRIVSSQQIWDISSCKAYTVDLYYLIPEGSFEFNYDPLELSYIQGENAEINVKVTNNWQNAKGKVSATFCMQTFGNPYCETYDRDMELNMVDTYSLFSIPTNFVVKNLTITPKLTLYYPNEFFVGLNVDCDGDGDIDNAEYCSNVEMQTLTFDKKVIDINIKPLYCEQDSDCITVKGVYGKCVDNKCDFLTEPNPTDRIPIISDLIDMIWGFIISLFGW